MVQELLALKVNACAHLVILVMQTITAKDAFYVDNVKSTKIVRARKFVSNSVAVFVIVLMRVANSPADQMRCVSRIIIVQLVFVAMVLLVIRMISVLAVNQANNSKHQIRARVMPNVTLEKFVLLVLMELEIVSIPATQLHAG